MKQLLRLLPLLLFACQTPTIVPTVSVPTVSVPTPPFSSPTHTPETPLPTNMAPTALPNAPTAVPPLPSPTASPTTIGAERGVPPEVVAEVQAWVAQRPLQYTWATTSPAQLELQLNPAGAPLIAEWVYAVVAPFPTVRDTISLPELITAWRTPNVLSGQAIGNPQWVANPAVTNLLTALWGEPANSLILSDDVAASLWAQRPSWSILPFDQLTPDLKVLAVGDQSPLSQEFQPAQYPLTVYVGLGGDPSLANAFARDWDHVSYNYDPAQLTSVAMTGVTALTRATAYEMELNGILYPGQAVSPTLKGADIAHISNEVAFSPTCPFPEPEGGTTFCASDDYFPLLTALGIDVVELTGNHVNDWGHTALSHSLDLYETAGIATFGGGRDLASAAQPALFEHHGNKIAFVGCNPVGPYYAWATATTPGARPCDDSFTQQISDLQTAGYVVIATLQYQEYYFYTPTLEQERDFAALATAGASAVSGSQGHFVQGFAFVNGRYIHYGLSNLFFDQMELLGTRQTFIDTYTIYQNRLISVTLWTGMLENWARPRLATPAERTDVLESLFQASGW